MSLVVSPKRRLLWSCTIPGTPRTKNAKRAFKIGAHIRVVDSKRSIEAEESTRAIVFVQRPPAPFDGPLIVDIVFTFAIPKSRLRGKHAIRPGELYGQRPDRGNLLKLLEDAMTGIVFVDDCQTAAGILEKRWGDVAGTTVEVWEP